MAVQTSESATIYRRQVARLQLGLRISAAMLVLFFAGAAGAVLLELEAVTRETGSWMGNLLAWSGDEGQEYVLMMSAIYITWGVFTWLAAEDPVRNRLMVQFAIAGNFAHLGVMALMATFDSSHRAHLLGDVPLGLVVPIVLAILWRPVRLGARAQAARATSQA